MPSVPLPKSYKTSKRESNKLHRPPLKKVPVNVHPRGGEGLPNDTTNTVIKSTNNRDRIEDKGNIPIIQQPKPISTPSTSLTSTQHSSTSNHSLNLSTRSNTNNKDSNPTQQFHRRQITKSSIPSLPKPSHKPPSSSNDFRGDLKSQDVFAAAFKKKNEKLRVLFPGMDRFEMERMDMFNHDCICTPCLIVQPKSNKEVSDTVTGYTYGVLKCLSANRKQNTKLVIPRLTIAGGRNSINAMRDGCIVLDMSRMRGIKVNRQSQECTIQGGVRVIDLDATLAEYGFIGVTSIFQGLGVVGSILSGGCGFSYASRKYGLACDNVLEAEVILADGRLKRCSKGRHMDLFHSLCGGGGGFGVVVSVTMKCYPLLHAALLTYDIPTSYKSEEIMVRRGGIIKEWAKWLHGDNDSDAVSSVGGAITIAAIANDNGFTNSRHMQQSSNNGVDDEIFSQLIIPTKQSSSIQFIGTSIDEKAIPQTDGFIEIYEEKERKNKRGILGGSMFARLKMNNSDVTYSFKQHSSDGEHYGWDQTPGLSDLITNKFGASVRQNVQFRMLRYADQLQSHSNEYFNSGNVYLSTKYAKCLSPRIIEILVQATLGDVSPNNESKIYIHALGGQVSKLNDFENVAFTARDIKYVIFIEGRWEAKSEHKYSKEKQKVTNWVNWVVNLLHREDGIQSTSHPESLRDQVPKRSKPPRGYYNFDQLSGTKLTETKNKRDPKNVFSLTSRVSYLHEKVLVPTQAKPLVPSSSIQPVRDGEICASECLTPTKIEQPTHAETLLESSSTSDVDVMDDLFNTEDNELNDKRIEGQPEENGIPVDSRCSALNDDSDVRRHKLTISNGGDVEVEDEEFYGMNESTRSLLQTEESSVTSDLKRLLSISDEDDDDLNNWSLTMLLGPVNEFEEGDSPTSVSDDASF